MIASYTSFHYALYFFCSRAVVTFEGAIGPFSGPYRRPTGGSVGDTIGFRFEVGLLVDLLEMDLVVDMVEVDEVLDLVVDLAD